MFSCQRTNFFYDINKKVFVLYLRLWCWRKITPAEGDAWFRCCGSLSFDSHDSSKINSRLFNLNSQRVENFISSPVRQPLNQKWYSGFISASKLIVFILNYNLVDFALHKSRIRTSPNQRLIFCHEQPFIKPGGGVNRRLISFRESWKIKCMMCRFTVSPGSDTCARHQSIAAKPYEPLSTCLLLNQYFQRRLFFLMLHLWRRLLGVNARKGNKVFTPRKLSLPKNVYVRSSKVHKRHF